MSDQWKKYTYRVQWSEEDGEYVGLCAEMSGLSWLAKTHEEAMAGIVQGARESVELLLEDGDEVPDPIATRAYSGEFKVRVPSEVHQLLALEAAERDISMNRICSAKLAVPMNVLAALSALNKLRSQTHQQTGEDLEVVEASDLRARPSQPMEHKRRV